MLSICLSAVLGLTAVAASANPTLDAETRIDCNPEQSYPDEGDADLAAELADDAYTCTALLNKGPLNSSDTIDQVGELWFLNDGGDLDLRVILFDGDNDDFDGDAKVCVDDDTDPINDIAAGGDAPAFCEGTDGNAALDKLSTGDPVPSKDADEEDAGAFEYLIDDIEGADGGFTVDINDFTEVVIHFNAFEGDNEDSTSIVAYFQPGGETPPGDEHVTKPTITSTPICGGDDTVTIPDTDGVTYLVGEVVVNGQTLDVTEAGLTVVASAEKGFVLDDADQEGLWVFEFDDDGATCARTTATPAAPTHTTNASCGVVDTYTIPTSEHVTYLVDGVPTAAGTYDLGEGDTVTITAVLDEGWVLAEGAVTEWEPFTGSEVQSCGGGGSSSSSSGSRNNSSNGTTTTTQPELGFTPEPEVLPEVIVAPAPTVAPEAAPVAELPFTGSTTTTLAMWAAGLMGLGSLLILGSRKRVQA